MALTQTDKAEQFCRYMRHNRHSLSPMFGTVAQHGSWRGWDSRH
jgi:hypothetical protein